MFFLIFKEASMIRLSSMAGLVAIAVLGGFLFGSRPQPPDTKAPPERPADAVADAQSPRDVPQERPEQKKNGHDNSDLFEPNKPAPLTKALEDQPGEGRVDGFDFSRDPFGASKPRKTFEEVMKAD